jgi:manganese/zinc/iron transport system substrate-binding protein
MKSPAALTLAAAVALLVSVLPLSAQDAPKKRTDIVATIGMVGDVVSNIVGDQAIVTTLIAPGVDPHLYRATRNDVVRMLKADMIFYSGLMLEGKMGDALVKVARSGKPVYAVTEMVDETYLLEPPEFEGHFDPHLWMDVRGWMTATEAIRDAMCEYDPQRREIYTANAAAYLKKLSDLDTWAKKTIESIPENRRVLITAHDAFNYFARAYGLHVRGVQGVSTDSEAGLDDLNELVDFIVVEKIPAIFVETSVSDRNMMALVEGAASRGVDVVIGGELFSDAMGTAGTYEGTYIGMIDHNVTTVARALGGSAAKAGMQGKLTGAQGSAP